MALNWCFNELRPSAANNSLLNYPAIPKPAYDAVRDACRPALVSARIPKFQWEGGETFHAEIWLLSDAPAAEPGGEVWAALVCGDNPHANCCAGNLPVWNLSKISPVRRGGRSCLICRGFLFWKSASTDGHREIHGIG